MVHDLAFLENDKNNSLLPKQSLLLFFLKLWVEFFRFFATHTRESNFKISISYLILLNPGTLKSIF